ncbi:MAG: metal-binding protein [Pleurocapsa sp.]
MPSGTTHDRITLWTLPWVSSITYGITHNGDLTLLLSGGFLFSGLMFGHDLDICSIQFKRWGWLRVIWKPYQKLFRHRSLFSHGPILGTCIRILYLLFFIAWIAIFAVGLAQLFFGFTWNWRDFVENQFHLLVHYRYRETATFFLGLELGAMSHSISDLISSNYKKRLKKKQSKKTKAGKIKR